MLQDIEKTSGKFPNITNYRDNKSVKFRNKLVKILYTYARTYLPIKPTKGTVTHKMYQRVIYKNVTVDYLRIFRNKRLVSMFEEIYQKDIELWDAKLDA